MGMKEMMEIARLLREMEMKQQENNRKKGFLLSETIKLCLHHLLKMPIALGLGGLFIFITLIFPATYSIMFSLANIWKGSTTEHISFGMSMLSLLFYCGLPFMTSYFLVYGVIGTIMFLFFNPERKPFTEYTFSWDRKELNFLDYAFWVLSAGLILYNIFFPLIVEKELREIFLEAAKREAILPIWIGVLKYYIKTVVVFGGILIGMFGLIAGVIYGISKGISSIFRIIS